ncbi:AraC family transcriptional regulator [Belliella sp. DSM 111904]|uniref:AraC family transcriptional regulator n=1 Tax=Belliella filtrata TaxID=2923435 RepID=A0ABS9V5L6_9BACT|nr:AraC family transcriptional regulator [Belliella filtrata]MCH7411708.1 AraC family transcriptional regulator [Belliella filtrata]
MTVKFFNPHPSLAAFVESIVLIKIDFNFINSPSSVYTFLPNHIQFLCFCLEDPVKVKKYEGDFESRSEAILIGQHLKPVTLDLGRKHTNLSIGLKPAGMYRLLGIPLEQIGELDMDARMLLGNEIDILVDMLLEAKTDDGMNEIIQSFLIKRLNHLRPLLPFDKAMLALSASNGNLSMDEVAALSCLSVRQFERISLQRIGHSPKLYSRLIRFSRAFKYKECNPKVSWSELAYRFGYFDHMHFIRDFKSFADFSPGSFKEDVIKESAQFHKLIT